MPRDNFQVADATAITPQRTPYPDAADIPEVEMEGIEKPSENPLVPAMETLAQFVQLQEQKGNPAAAEMKQHLTAFMQAAVKGAGGADQQIPPKKQYDDTPIFDAHKPPPEEPTAVRGTDNRNTSIQPLV